MNPGVRSQESESSRPEPRAPRLTPLPIWQPPRPSKAGQRPKAPPPPAPPVTYDLDTALDATIARLTGHHPCRGCGG